MSEPIRTKQCSKCKKIKPVSDFRNNRKTIDGLSYYCRFCMNEYASKYRNTVNYKTSKERYRKTLKNKDAQNRYNKSKKGKNTRLKNVKCYQKRNPDKLKAQHTINHLIERGKLPKASTKRCHYCNKTASQYHHYLGYDKIHWFNVIPICAKCHKKIH